MILMRLILEELQPYFVGKLTFNEDRFFKMNNILPECDFHQGQQCNWTRKSISDLDEEVIHLLLRIHLGMFQCQHDLLQQ